MPKGAWQLVITSDFSAAHQLRNYGGKCENMHGHNFGVEVTVEGDVLDKKVQYLMDFGELKKHTKAVLAELDHKHLNSMDFFKDVNPSSENIAMYIYTNIKDKMPQNVRLISVGVSEKDSSKAVYFEWDEDPA